MTRIRHCAPLLLGVCLALSTFVASADPQPLSVRTVTLDIKAQAVGPALNEFARQTGLDVLLYTNIAKDVTTNDLVGTFNADDALKKLLENTGLTYTYVGPEEVAIHRIANRASASSVSSAEASLHPMRLAAQRSDKPTTAPQQNASSKDPSTTRSVDRRQDTTAAEQIIVTGTRIRGAMAPIGTPIYSLDREEIERRGAATAQELMQSIQQNFRGGAAGAIADTKFSSGPGSGFNTSFGSGVNIRGLGATATLVLVNGHRVASSGSGYFTDISTIPVSAIDRIDVLTDGASAIYGSDAIGGVINIILKQESDGLEIGVRSGTTTYDGYSTRGAALQGGTTWDHFGGGAVTVGIDYSHQSSFDATERPFTSAVTSPTSIFPPFDQVAVSAAGRQAINDRVSIHTDLQYADVNRTAFVSTSPTSTFKSDPNVERWSGSAGGEMEIGNSLSFRYDFSAGEESNDLATHTISDGGASSFLSNVVTRSAFTDHSAALTGDLASLPGGPLRFAVGGSYRTEKFTSAFAGANGAETFDKVARDVAAGYAELSVPIIGERNAFPGFKELKLLAAVRHDSYSDRGGPTNLNSKSRSVKWGSAV